MGLVGFLLAPLLGQMSIDLLPPRDFVRRPLLWLDLIARNRGTISYSPSFGYELCARAATAARCRPTSTCRAGAIAGLGGDMVRARRADALRRDASPPAGFKRDGLRRRATAWPRPRLAITFARSARACASTWSTAPAGEAQRAVPAADPATRRARAFVRCGPVAAGPRLRGPRRGRRVLAGPRGRPHLRPRPEPDAGLLRRARGDARGAVAPTAGSTPATSATRWTARSSSPAAPRT